MEILHQLGELFLAAVPTAVFVLIFYFFLRWSFFGPITRVMAERHASIEGARRYAESVRAAAQEKNKTYQETLRKAMSMGARVSCRNSVRMLAASTWRPSDIAYRSQIT